jgi:hypothetical protein
VFVCLSPISPSETVDESMKRGVGVKFLEKIRESQSQCLAVGNIKRIYERNFLRRAHNISTSDPEVISCI